MEEILAVKVTRYKHIHAHTFTCTCTHNCILYGSIVLKSKKKQKKSVVAECLCEELC